MSNSISNKAKSLATLAGACGLSILVAGVMLLFFLHEANNSVKAHIVIGAFLFFLGLLANYQTIWRYLKSAKGKTVMISIAFLLLNAYNLMCINYISYKHRIRADFTKTKRYTLSDKTIKILNTKVKNKLYFIVNESLHEDSLKDLNELINQFTFHCDKIIVKRYNPLTNPNQSSSIQKMFNLKSDYLMIVASEFKGSSIDKAPLINPANNKITWFKAEQTIINSILNTISNKRTKIGFLTGNGEPSIEETNKTNLNLSQLKNWLINENFIVEEINLYKTNAPIPNDCDVLVSVGASKLIPKEHINLINEYLNRKTINGRNGCLIYANSPQFISSNRKLTWAETGIEDVLLKRGIYFENKMLVEKQELVVPSLGPFSIFIPPENIINHKITDPIKSANLNLAWRDKTRSIGVSSTERLFNPMPLLASSPDCRGINDVKSLEKSMQEKTSSKFLMERTPARFIVALCTAETTLEQRKKEKLTETDFDPTGTKIVVFGNSACFLTPMLENDRDLFINSIKWLTQETESIGLGTAITEKTTWVIPAEKEWFYREIIFYLMPLSWVLIGGIVWWYRKG